jgi:lipoate-protein ligase A
MALALLQSLPAPATLPPCIEEALIERGPGAEPTLFAYSWDSPALVLGYGQTADEIDLAACRTDGVTVLRRRTGGTGVYVNGDLGLSLALPPEHPWARDLGTLYDRFLDALVEALAAVGQPALRVSGLAGTAPRTPLCFEGQLRESLLVGGRKAVGCAQMRRRGGVLVHATLLLHLDARAQARAFGMPVARIEAALAPLTIAAREPVRLVAEVARALSRALGLPLVERPLPPVPTAAAARYAESRWCPVPPPTRHLEEAPCHAP